jgi:hypothetical protein
MSTTDDTNAARRGSGSNDLLGLLPECAKVGDTPLCEQMQALQSRAAKLRPIELEDAALDAADPYTRLFLLAEYWQQQAHKAREALDDECNRTDSLLTILGVPAERCRSEGGNLIPRKVLTLMGEARAAAGDETANLRAALQWYADGLHFDRASPDAWDTVSGEPPNWWCDEAGTATVEDGSIAAMVLRGELTGAQVQALD